MLVGNAAGQASISLQESVTTMTVSFTPEKRERLLTLMETGRTLKEASLSVKVSRQTVNRWHVAGLKDGAERKYRDFAERYELLRNGPGGENLSQADLVRLLEISARQGSVQAIKMLLDRPWEKQKQTPEENPVAPVLSLLDKLADKRATN